MGGFAFHGSLLEEDAAMRMLQRYFGPRLIFSPRTGKF
jgi:hypothetical protein